MDLTVSTVVKPRNIFFFKMDMKNKANKEELDGEIK
jgi:hypothetical protein